MKRIENLHLFISVRRRSIFPWNWSKPILDIVIQQDDNPKQSAIDLQEGETLEIMGEGKDETIINVKRISDE